MLLKSADGPIRGEHYVPATPDTCSWGRLPVRGCRPVAVVQSGDTVTFDTVSHEGILEDQGRDPLAFFGRFGVPAREVLDDAIAIAASSIDRTGGCGPHVVTGPVAVQGARAGDILRVDVCELLPRSSYGIVSNRHSRGALPAEFPEDATIYDGGSASRVTSHFVRVLDEGGRSVGDLVNGSGPAMRFPLRPFLGLMGVAPNVTQAPNSIPPGRFGGNLDVSDLVVGSSIYLPVHVDGGMFYVGDPHFAQGNGEVALTAFEAPLRATLRLTTIAIDDHLASWGSGPVIETDRHWIVVGLHQDLDIAVRIATRNAVDLLTANYAISRSAALSYLSMSGDLAISQVVNIVKGVHFRIPKEIAMGRVGIAGQSV